MEYELATGDTVLCISSSRDIRKWKKETWGENVIAPMSFSGNDLLNLLAIPMRRVNEDADTTISIDREGNVKVSAKKLNLMRKTSPLPGNWTLKATFQAQATSQVTGKSKPPET